MKKIAFFLNRVEICTRMKAGLSVVVIGLAVMVVSMSVIRVSEIAVDLGAGATRSYAAISYDQPTFNFWTYN